MECHVPSWSPCLLRCFAVPFVHIVPPPRSFLLRSVCPSAGWRRDPLSRVFACGRGRVFAPARFARLIARARGNRPARLSRQALRNVMFPMPSVKLCRSVPAYRSSVAFRSAPFRPRRRLGCPQAAGPFFARVSCVRARARRRAFRAGAVRAPDCAREAADAHLPSAPAGAFFGPSRILRRKAKGGPGSRLSAIIIAHFSRTQALVGYYFFSTNKSPLSAGGGVATGARCSLRMLWLCPCWIDATMPSSRAVFDQRHDGAVVMDPSDKTRPTLPWPTGVPLPSIWQMAQLTTMLQASRMATLGLLSNSEPPYRLSEIARSTWVSRLPR